MKSLILIFSMLALCEMWSFAQSDICYSPSRKEAMKEFEAKRFKNAKEIFIAMKFCPDKPEKNDLSFWINKCTQALSPQMKQDVATFADKMSQYEEYSSLGFNEGMMAVQRKADWNKYKNMPEGSDALDYLPKVGFVNEAGNLVIPCIYEDPDYYSMTAGYFFSDGVAAVIKRFPTSEGAWEFDDMPVSFGWGYIDKKGNTIVPFKYLEAHAFSEGLAAVVDNEEGRWKFIDKKGNVAFPKTYKWAGVFSDGMCIVQSDTSELYGFIDTKGNLVIPAKYTSVHSFEKGVAAVFTAEHPYEAALINKEGRMVGDFTFRPEYLSLADMYEFIIDCYNNEQYEKCYMGLEARKQLCHSKKWTQHIYFYDLPFVEGYLYYNGYGGCPKDYHKAYSIFKEGRTSNCLFMQALCKYYGYGTEQNYTEALELSLKAIEQDNFDKAGYVSLSTGVSCGILKRRFTKGDVYYLIGTLYYEGKGVPVDYNIALTYYEKAKKEGNKTADRMVDVCKTKLN